MSKTPNLRQPSTGPTIYPAMKLPPVVNVPKGIDPGLAQLGRIQQPAPQPQLNRTPAPSRPLGPMTNSVNQVRK
jgi:hypothetical protein